MFKKLSMVTLAVLSHDNVNEGNLARGDYNFADIWSNFLKGGLNRYINTVYKYRSGIDSSDCQKPACSMVQHYGLSLYKTFLYNFLIIQTYKAF